MSDLAGNPYASIVELSKAYLNKSVSPSEVTKAERLAITSIPNTVPPVNTDQRIVTGSTAIIIDISPPKNPTTYLITESICFPLFYLIVLWQYRQIESSLQILIRI